MDIEHVLQEDNDGCGPACLAMIAGWTYAEAVKLWPKLNFRRNGGLSRVSLDRALARLGYAVCRREDTRRPFGEVHLVEIQDESMVKKKQGWHWVILLADGTVYDPGHAKPGRIEDYYHVRAMAAVVHIHCGNEG